MGSAEIRDQDIDQITATVRSGAALIDMEPEPVDQTGSVVNEVSNRL